jgi:pimeloyl-ACP methyl ester carboxylesterase
MQKRTKTIGLGLASLIALLIMILTAHQFVRSFISDAPIETEPLYTIPVNIRFTLERECCFPPIVYYFTKPDITNKTYPILILCEGSSSKGELGSVFYMHDYFSERIKLLNVGFITIEKWGIDGNQIDDEAFWNHYSRSQRLEDHLKVIRYLEDNPPECWNGKLIFVGVSEGGPLVTQLSTIYPNTLATINWAGAGDWPWADEIWQFFEHWKRNSLWMKLYDAIPRWIPFSSDVPKTRSEFNALVDQIIHNPTPNQWMGGMTYFYHADAFQHPPVEYRKIKSPFLVVMGTEDSNLDSCDQFVQKADQFGVQITYFRVDGMDHYIRNRPDLIDQSFDWLKLQISSEESLECISLKQTIKPGEMLSFLLKEL